MPAKLPPRRKLKAANYRVIRRDVIIKAATKAFLEQGFHDVTLAQIVDKVGGSMATIYKLFGDKAGLFAAVLESVGNSNMLVWPQGVKGKGAPREALETLGLVYVDACVGRKAISFHRLVTSEAGQFTRIGEIVFRDIYRVLVAHVARYLEDQTAAGKMNIPDPIVAANFFLGGVLGEFQLRAVFDPQNRPNKLEIKKHVRESVRLFLAATAINTIAGDGPHAV